MIPYVEGQFEEEEEKAYECFKKFADEHPESFKNYSQTTYGTFYDVSATSRTGQEEVIELKVRADGSDTFPTCYIEPHKFENLMKAYRNEGALPIYFSFIGDYTNVYMWQLNNLKEAHYHIGKFIQGSYQDRIGLNWDDAYHYIYDEKNNKYNMINRGK